MSTEPRPQILLDAPQLDAAGNPASVIQIAKIGDFRDPRYGKFSITREEVEAWGRNLAKLPGQQAPIDEDHLADKPGPHRRTEASGWITDITLDSDGIPRATVEWNSKGAKAIQDKRYLFISPTYGKWADEQGVEHDDVLSGAALSNRPFLNMPMIQLSRAPEAPWDYETVTLAADEPDSSSDSRRQMSDTATDLTKLATALGVAEDADEAKLLEAITALKTPEPTEPATKELAEALGLKADADPPKLLEAVTALKAKTAEPEDTKTLEQRASEAGLEVVDRKTLDTLNAAASKVVTLETKLGEIETERSEQRFTLAWEKALGDPKGPRVAPAEEDAIRELYAASPDATLKMLEARTPIVNAKPKSGTSGDMDEAPAGVDADSYQLDKRVQAYMLDKSEADYMRALIAVRQLDALGATA